MKFEANLLYAKRSVNMEFFGSEEYMKYISKKLWEIILCPEKAIRIPKYEPENFFELLANDEIDFNDFEVICLSGKDLLAYKVSILPN